MKKKILILLSLLFFVFNNVNAYTSEELITLYINDPDVWTSVYIVPEWKDLILNRITSSSDTKTLDLRNWTGPILARVTWKTEYLGGNLTIKDDLQVEHNPDAWEEYYMIFWFLVSEDEDIENYINWNEAGINKNVFTKEDLEFIYFREFVFFTIIWIFKFFEVTVLRRKTNFRLF
jgi:hypothetical protein